MARVNWLNGESELAQWQGGFEKCEARAFGCLDFASASLRVCFAVALVPSAVCAVNLAVRLPSPWPSAERWHTIVDAYEIRFREELMPKEEKCEYK